MGLLSDMMCRPGSWSLRSEKDPRWNCDGRAEVMIITAGLPPKVTKKIEKLKKKYGEPPEDLEYSCMKD